MNGKEHNPFEVGRLLLKRPVDPDRSVEIVLGISAGESMRPLWMAFSREMNSFVSDLHHALRIKMKGKYDRLRLRFIAFGDLFMDDRAMQVSPFFEIPGEEAQLALFLRLIESNGGEEKKSGLEALYCAMHSQWTRTAGVRRHMIALISDVPAYSPEEPLRWIDVEYARRLEAYLPKEHVTMPRTLDEMRKLWRDGAGEMDNWKHRLLIIAPECEPWMHMSGWDETRVITKPKEQISKLCMAELVRQLTELA